MGLTEAAKIGITKFVGQNANKIRGARGAPDVACAEPETIKDDPDRRAEP